jgi:hypothetical protein
MILEKPGLPHSLQQEEQITFFLIQVEIAGITDNVNILMIAVTPVIIMAETSRIRNIKNSHLFLCNTKLV